VEKDFISEEPRNKAKKGYDLNTIELNGVLSLIPLGKSGLSLIGRLLYNLCDVNYLTFA